ncbi:MAG: topoisomerase C-terminal repeat-containing protein [Limnohabitans sp.]
MKNIIDFNKDESLGACPICGSDVYEAKNAFSCRKLLESQDSSNPSCSFKISKIILEQSISRDQCVKFLKDRRTDYFDGFTSLRTQKTFRARLYWDTEVNKVAMDVSELQSAPEIKKQDPVKRGNLNCQKVSNDFNLLRENFNKKHYLASEEFLKKIFEISSHLDLNSASDKEFPKISDVLRAIDQSVLNSFVERHDCPDWLGAWIAKFGKKRSTTCVLVPTQHCE